MCWLDTKFLVIFLLFFGDVVSALEEPEYQIIKNTPNFEIRHYSEYLVAEVTLKGSFNSSGNQAFRILAGYIFGSNQTSEKMKMTAPVESQVMPASEKMKMTAPVMSVDNNYDEHIYRFVMEKKYTPKGKINLTMNRSSDDLEISGVNGLELNSTWINYSLKKDSIEFWIDTNDTKEKFISILIDDKSNEYIDTIKITTTTAKKAQISPFAITNNAKKGLDNHSDLRLLFNKPLAKIDDSKLKLELRGEKAQFNVTQKRGQEVIVSSAWVPGKKYDLTICPNAFTNLLGESTDTVKVSFKYKEEKDYGKLFLNTEVEEGDYILQLLKDGKVVSQKTFEGDSFKHNYNQLSPGQYQLKLIYDENNNSKWDTGIYLKHLQPETVVFYDGEISIRQGWDINLTWKL